MTFEQWLERAGVKDNPFIAEPVISWCRAAWESAIESEMNCYHFPETRFVSENNSNFQLKVINGEFCEMQNEVPGSEEELVEAWDLLHSVETWLRIRQKEGADVQRAKQAVYDKNKGRGYYKLGRGANGPGY